MPPLTRTVAPVLASDGQAVSAPRHSRGQVIAIFALSIFVFVGMMAVVIDVSWYWLNTQRVQKAADAAALAGVVWMPGSEAKAIQTALYEAAKNGYDVATNGVPQNGLTITVAKDSTSSRRLNVSISAPVTTFFMRVFGIDTIQARAKAKAEYVLPVPMGSPENYYGVFGPVRDATMTTTGTVSHPNTTEGPNATTTVAGTTSWSGTGNVGTNDGNYASSTSANGSNQSWRDFGFTFTTPVATIDGIQVTARARTPSGTGSGAQSDCHLLVDLSWDGGGHWSAQQDHVLTTSEVAIPYGATNDVWGHPWAAAELANGSTHFRVRLTLSKPTSNCSATRIAQVDQLQVTVTYTYTTTSTTTTTATYDLHGPGTACANGATDANGDPNCFVGTPAGGGQVLNPRGFWATMNTEGADNVNGDAYQPYYSEQGNGEVAPTCPSATGLACYGPDDYYNYAIEMPPNTTGGYVYIFDPVFCATSISSGTGDRWFSGSNAISSFYELYTTGTNLYSRADDSLIISSDDTFRQIDADDSEMGGSGGANECRQTNTAYRDGRDFHDSWYLLNPDNPLQGGTSGTIYRLHTTGTDPLNLAQQRNANGEQSFAIYATDDQAPTTYPKVYGLGAMQMFTPLSASPSPTVTSTFYLAQIDAVHAGKTLELRLWDPGDTGWLTANISVQMPYDASSYRTVTTLNYSAFVGTSNNAANGACNSNAQNNQSSIQTATGNNTTGLFNGCWLTIDMTIPPGYTAPTGGDPSGQPGWWKIVYTMHNTRSGTDTSNDVTTWTAEIKGNPVHLLVP